MEILSLLSAIFPLIQYPAAFLTCAGYYFVGSKSANIRKTGFTLGVIGNIIWMIYGISPIQPGIIVTNLFVLAFGIRGYVNNSYKVDPELLDYMEKNDLIIKNK
jgi:hypothetical protein